MRRAFTMIELLAALGLLAVVMAAAASWVQVTARAGTTRVEPARWRAAAEAVLGLVHDDLAGGDLGAGARRPHVEVVDGVLVLRTRAPGTGPVAHRYRLDAARRGLEVERRPAGGRRSTRRLLDDVSVWRCEIDDGVLAVTVSSGETTVTRRYAL